MSSDMAQLKDLIDVSPKVPMSKGQQYPFMDMAAVTEWQRDVPLKSLVARAFNGSGSKFQSGDILLARITPCFENGKVAVAPKLTTPGHGSTEFIVIRPKHVDDGAFIYGLLRSSEFREHAIKSMVGSSGRQRIPSSALASYPAELPDQAYRAKASKLLETIEDLRADLQTQNHALEAISTALFRSWFVNFDPVRSKVAGSLPDNLSAELAALFPDEFEESAVGQIPSGWTVSTFGDAFDIKGGGTPSTKEPTYWDNGTHWWATPKDMSGLSSKVLHRTERKLTPLGVQKISSKTLPTGTTLMSSRAPVGYLAVAKAPVSINQGFIAIPPTEGIASSFIIELLESKMAEIRSHAGGTTFAEISKTQFRPIKWVRPTQEVLAAHERIAEPLYEVLFCNSLLIDELSAFRDALLPRLISGKLLFESAEAALAEITSGLETQPA